MSAGSLHALAEATAGVAGGLLSATVVYPLELAKNRIQVQTKGQETQFSGVQDVLLHTYKEEGIAGLFKGIKAEYTKETAKCFCTFFWYKQLKNIQQRYARKRYEKTRKNSPTLVSQDEEEAKSEQMMDLWINIGLGMLASSITVLVFNPLSVTTLRVQARSNKAPDAGYGLIRSMVYLAQKDGISSFYSGILPALLLTINPAIQLSVFDKLRAIYINTKLSREKERRKKRSLPKRNDLHINCDNEAELKHELEVRPSEIHLNSLENFTLGAISKAVATIVTYPYILGKIRLQFSGDDPNAQKFRGVLHWIYHIFRSEGFPGLFQGIQPQLLKSVVSSGLVFMTKEKTILYTLTFFNKLGLI